MPESDPFLEWIVSLACPIGSGIDAFELDPNLRRTNKLTLKKYLNMIGDNVARTLERIESACCRVGRRGEEITLVAVSKQRSCEQIVAAYEAGLRDFGENRVEELEEKSEALKGIKDIRWHFIGQLQSRQSSPVAEFAHNFHAIDRVKIATRLSAHLTEIGRKMRGFVQVNISGEISKGGFPCQGWQTNESLVVDLLDSIRNEIRNPNLIVEGLMTMAPQGSSEAQLREIFRGMRELANRLNGMEAGVTDGKLSMGMSGDFEIAIEEGATHVRIGGAIFN